MTRLTFGREVFIVNVLCPSQAEEASQTRELPSGRSGQMNVCTCSTPSGQVGT